MPLPALLAAVPALAAAGGSIAGAVTAGQGGLNSGDMINISNNPFQDAALQRATNDALSGIGGQDISREVTPIQSLANQINMLGLDKKTKSRALKELGEILNGVWTGGKWIDIALASLGKTRSDLTRDIERSRLQTEQSNRLEAEFRGRNEQIIKDRATIQDQATQQGLAAAQFSSGGDALNALSQNLLDRDNRQLADLRDQALTQANFGNINPGQAFKSIQDAQLDQNIRLLEQSLGIAGGLNSFLGTGTAQAVGAATGNANAVSGAAQIAAQQANASNQLRNQNSIDNALSLGNGINGAFQGIGGAISDVNSYYQNRENNANALTLAQYDNSGQR